MGFFDAILDFLGTILFWVVNILIAIGCTGAGLFMFIRSFNLHSGTKGQRFL